jgi:hypothetical protein
MRCPVCRREFDRSSSPVLPFCSERCRTIDLGRWLGEEYRIPVSPEPDTDASPETDAAEGNGVNGEAS